MKRFGLIALLLTACAADPQPAVFAPDLLRYLGPTVVTSDPLVGSQGVPVDYPVRITISSDLAPETVTGAVAVRGTRSDFPARVGIEGPRTIRIDAAWPARERIRIRIGSELLDAQGRSLRDQNTADSRGGTPFALHFTTGTDALGARPRVLEVTPAPGADRISPLVEPLLIFSKRMRFDPAPVLRLSDGAGEAVVSGRWEADRTQLRVSLATPLRYDTAYEIEVREAVDAWGLAAEPGVLTWFRTQAAEGHVVLNEVVTSPRTDWNDTAGGNGVAFDGEPGTGSITTSDEFIELYNGSSRAADLRGWTLEQLDGSDAVHAFGAGSSVTERFVPESSTVDHFEPGAYLVLGNPVGDNGDRTTFILRDDAGWERDRVTLGTDAPEGSSTNADDESVARIPDGTDTDGASDWRKARATPGAPN